MPSRGLFDWTDCQDSASTDGRCAEKCIGWNVMALVFGGQWVLALPVVGR